MDTNAGASTTPTSGPLGTPLTEATGYVMDVHDDFWQATPLDRRTMLITEFAGRAHEAKAAMERVTQAV